MRATVPAAPLTLAAFLDWEERQPERFELVGGVVRTMAWGHGGSRPDRRQRPCSSPAPLARDAVFRPRVEPEGAEPRDRRLDVPRRVRPRGPRDGGRTRTDDPVIAFEVLSEGTAQHDPTRKRPAYEVIPTLRRLVYASTVEPRLDVRVRGRTGSGATRRSRASTACCDCRRSRRA
jgi:hypothetical protein